MYSFINAIISIAFDDVIEGMLHKVDKLDYSKEFIVGKFNCNQIQ